MAKGAATLTKRWAAKPEWGALKKAFLTLTLTDNYKTGGYTCDLTYFGGLSTIDMVHLPPAVSGYVPEYDETNKKLLFYYQDCNGLSDSALIELADDSDVLVDAVVFITVEGRGV